MNTRHRLLRVVFLGAGNARVPCRDRTRARISARDNNWSQWNPAQLCFMAVSVTIPTAKCCNLCAQINPPQGRSWRFKAPSLCVATAASVFQFIPVSCARHPISLWDILVVNPWRQYRTNRNWCDTVVQSPSIQIWGCICEIGPSFVLSIDS